MRIEMQFQHINETVEQFQQQTSDFSRCEEKELIGAYKNAGVEWQPKENPFPSNNMILWTRNWEKDSLWRYDLMQNKGWVSVGVDHETASLAVETIRQVPDGAIRLSAGNGVINYRLWWQQQLSQSLVEMGTATTGNLN